MNDDMKYIKELTGAFYKLHQDLAKELGELNSYG